MQQVPIIKAFILCREVHGSDIITAWWSSKPTFEQLAYYIAILKKEEYEQLLNGEAVKRQWDYFTLEAKEESK